MPAPTSRRTPASCWSAASSPWPSPGACDGIPDDFCFDELPEDFDAFRADPGGGHPPRAGAGQGRHPAVLQRPRELHAGRSLPARRGAGGARTSSSPPASTPSASSRPAAPARCWRTGSSTAIRRWICGTSTSAASCRSSATGAICATARSKRSACSMRCTGRSASTRRRAACADRRCTTASRRAAPASARSPAGSGQLVRARGCRRRDTNTATGGRTGSSTPPRSTARCARRSASSTSRSFAKFLVERRRRRAVLNRICANDVAVPLGSRRLHAVAQRARRHRGRSHRHAPGRGPLSHRDLGGVARRATWHWLQRHITGGRARRRVRRHVGLWRARRDGAALARIAAAR